MVGVCARYNAKTARTEVLDTQTLQNPPKHPSKLGGSRASSQLILRFQNFFRKADLLRWLAIGFFIAGGHEGRRDRDSAREKSCSANVDGKFGAKECVGDKGISGEAIDSGEPYSSESSDSEMSGINAGVTVLSGAGAVLTPQSK